VSILRDVLEQTTVHPDKWSKYWLKLVDDLLDPVRVNSLYQEELRFLENFGIIASQTKNLPFRMNDFWRRLVREYDRRKEKKDGNALISRIYFLTSSDQNVKETAVRTLIKRKAAGSQEVKVYIDFLLHQPADKKFPTLISFLEDLLRVSFHSDPKTIKRAGLIGKYLYKKKVSVKGLYKAIGIFELITNESFEKAILWFEKGISEDDTDIESITGYLRCAVHLHASHKLYPFIRTGLQVDDPVALDLLTVNRTQIWMDNTNNTLSDIDPPVSAENFTRLKHVQSVRKEILDFIAGRLWLIEGNADEAFVIFFRLFQSGSVNIQILYYLIWAALLTGQVDIIRSSVREYGTTYLPWYIICLVIDADPIWAQDHGIRLMMPDDDPGIHSIITARKCLIELSMFPADLQKISRKPFNFEERLEITRTYLGIWARLKNTEYFEKRMQSPVFYRLPIADRNTWKGIQELIRGNKQQGETILAEVVREFRYARAAYILSVSLSSSGSVYLTKDLLNLAFSGRTSGFDSKKELLESYYEVILHNRDGGSVPYDNLISADNSRIFHHAVSLLLHEADIAREKKNFDHALILYNQAKSAIQKADERFPRDQYRQGGTVDGLSIIISSLMGDRRHIQELCFQHSSHYSQIVQPGILWQILLCRLWYGNFMQQKKAADHIIRLIRSLSRSGSTIPDNILIEIARTALYNYQHHRKSSEFISLIEVIHGVCDHPEIKRIDEIAKILPLFSNLEKPPEEIEDHVIHSLVTGIEQDPDSVVTGVYTAGIALRKKDTRIAVDVLQKIRYSDKRVQHLCGAVIALLNGSAIIQDIIKEEPVSKKNSDLVLQGMLEVIYQFQTGNRENGYTSLCDIYREFPDECGSIISMKRFLPGICAIFYRDANYTDFLKNLIIQQYGKVTDERASIALITCASLTSHSEESFFIELFSQPGLGKHYSFELIILSFIYFYTGTTSQSSGSADSIPLSSHQKRIIETFFSDLLNTSFESDVSETYKSALLGKILARYGIHIPEQYKAMGIYELVHKADYLQALQWFKQASMDDEHDSASFMGYLTCAIHVRDFASVQRAVYPGFHGDYALVQDLITVGRTLLWIYQITADEYPPASAREVQDIPIIRVGEWDRDFIAGRSWLIEGNAKEALHIFSRLIQSNPSSRECLYYLVWSALLTGQMDIIHVSLNSTAKTTLPWYIISIAIDADPGWALTHGIQLNIPGDDPSILPIIKIRQSLIELSEIPTEFIKISRNPYNQEEEFELTRTYLGWLSHQKKGSEIEKILHSPVFMRLPLAERHLWEGVYEIVEGNIQEGEDILEKIIQQSGYSRAAYILSVSQSLHESHTVQKDLLNLAFHSRTPGSDIKREIFEEYVRVMEQTSYDENIDLINPIVHDNHRIITSALQLFIHQADYARFAKNRDKALSLYNQAKSVIQIIQEKGTSTLKVYEGIIEAISLLILALHGDRNLIKSYNKSIHVTNLFNLPKGVAWQIALGQFWYGDITGQIEGTTFILDYIHSVYSSGHTIHTSHLVEIARTALYCFHENPKKYEFFSLINKIGEVCDDHEIIRIAETAQVLSYISSYEDQFPSYDDAVFQHIIDKILVHRHIELPVFFAAGMALHKDEKEIALSILKNNPLHEQTLQHISDAIVSFIQRSPISPGPVIEESADDRNLQLFLLKFIRALSEFQNGMPETGLKTLYDLYNMYPTEISAIIKINRFIPGMYAVLPRDKRIINYHKDLVLRKIEEISDDNELVALIKSVITISRPEELCDIIDRLPSERVQSIPELSNLLNYLCYLTVQDYRREDQARELWKEYVKNPSDISVLHTLALIYNAACTDNFVKNIINYDIFYLNISLWCYLLSTDEFWDYFITDRLPLSNHEKEFLFLSEHKENVCTGALDVILFFHYNEGRNSLARKDTLWIKLHINCLDIARNSDGRLFKILAQFNYPVFFQILKHRMNYARQIADSYLDALSTWIIGEAESVLIDPGNKNRFPEGMTKNYPDAISKLDLFLTGKIPETRVLSIAIRWINEWCLDLYHLHRLDEMQHVLHRSDTHVTRLIPLCRKGYGHLPENQAISGFYLCKGIISGDPSRSKLCFQESLAWDPENRKARELLELLN
jgi:tetratricopeptide (TPR) repeat protein